MTNCTISFNNFKAFGKKIQTFQKKPITLIYGPNSVGKSSFIHAMVYKEQILNKNFSPIKVEAGDVIDLDGFLSFIHQKKLTNNTNFHLKSEDNALFVEIGIANGVVLPLYLQYQKNNIELANITLLSDNKYEIVINITHPIIAEKIEKIKNNGTWSEEEFWNTIGSRESISYVINKEEFLFISDEYYAFARDGRTSTKELEEQRIILRDKAISKWSPDSEQSKTIIANTKIGFMQLSPDILEGSSREEVIELIKQLYDAKDIMNSLKVSDINIPTETFVFDENEILSLKLFITQFALEETFEINRHFKADKKIHYFGPLRFYPERGEKYEMLNSSNFKIEDMNSKTFWAIFTQFEKARDKVNPWLKKLQTPYHMELKKTYDLTNLFSLEQEKYTKTDIEIHSSVASELVFRDPRTDTLVHNREIGLGITQVLPIVGSTAILNNTLIAIEQPELHLHPKLQMELADEFIRSANEQSNEFMIETHSEHLLLRIMKRMRQTAEGKVEDESLKLTPDDVCLLYVDNDDESTYLQELRLSQRGTLLDHWPHGFFEEGYKERFS